MIDFTSKLNPPQQIDTVIVTADNYPTNGFYGTIALQLSMSKRLSIHNDLKMSVQHYRVTATADVNPVRWGNEIVLRLWGFLVFIHHHIACQRHRIGFAGNVDPGSLITGDAHLFRRQVNGV